MNSHSGAWLPRERVIAAAMAAITHVKNLRAMRLTKLDERKANKRWWQFGPTEQDYIHAAICGSYMLDVSESLLDIALATSELLVFVTTDDFESISSYYGKQQ